MQESWAHENVEMSQFLLPNYSLIFENRRLSTHGGLIMYIHDDFAYKISTKRLLFLVHRPYLKVILLKYGEKRADFKNMYLVMSIVCHRIMLRTCLLLQTSTVIF